MTPLKERSRKRTIRKMRQQESIRIHMSKLVMYGVFLATVAVITSATTSAQAQTTAMTPKEMGYATGQLGKKHLESRNDSNNYYGFRQTPPQGYFGNWGFAPGGSHWDPNYKWRRSLGFWDTNSPACPFRYC
jgi:arylsulfatase A-like enzyme